jgi:membrane-associated phospholipid phosphatase
VLGIAHSTAQQILKLWAGTGAHMSDLNMPINSATALQYESSEPNKWPLSRCYAAPWAILVAVCLIDIVWLTHGRHTILSGTLESHIRGPLALALIALILRRLLSRSRYVLIGRMVHAPEVAAICEAIGLLALFAYAMLVLQSLCVAFAAPLIDDKLVALDAVMGFSWADVAKWYSHHQAMYDLLGYVYLSYEWQVFFIVILLGITKRFDDLYEFLILFTSTAALTVLISAIIPASNPFIHFGVFGHYQPSPWSQFFPLRDGSIIAFNLDDGQGLVSMPSLHTVDAVLFVYALRHVKIAAPCSIGLNAVMVYSAIMCGAHYLVDIIAGAALAIAAIGLLRQFPVHTSYRTSQTRCVVT